MAPPPSDCDDTNGQETEESIFSDPFDNMGIRVLAVGYFGRSNWGDECFKFTFTNFFGNGITFEFCKPFELAEKDPNNYSALVVGPGDVIWPDFMGCVRAFAVRSRIPVYALSCGLSYTDQTRLIDMCDFAHMRSRQDYQLVAPRLGTEWTLYHPDIVFITHQLTDTWKRSTNKHLLRIGLCLARPIITNNAANYDLVVSKIAELVRRVGKEYPQATFYFIPFDTNGCNTTNCDYYINADVRRKLQRDFPLFDRLRLLSETDTVPANTPYPAGMYNIFGQLDLAICMRYHSVVTSLVTNTPFVAIYTTRKVGMLLSDLGLSAQGYRLPTDSETNAPTDLDVDAAFALVQSVATHRAAIMTRGRDPETFPFMKWTNAFSYIQRISGLLSSGERRTSGAAYLSLDSEIDMISQSANGVAKAFLRMLAEIVPDFDYGMTADQIGRALLSGSLTVLQLVSFIKSTYDALPTTKEPLSDALCEEIYTHMAQIVCYTCTRQSGSSYVYGLSQRLMMEEPGPFKDMVVFIAKDFALTSRLSVERLVVPDAAPIALSGLWRSVKINLWATRMETYSGLHRSGWSYALAGLNALHSEEESAIIIDSYADQTFGWNRLLLEDTGVIPYTKPFIAFFHHTFDSDGSPNNMCQVLEAKSFADSLPYCKCIIVLSRYLQQQLTDALKIRFPTQTHLPPVHALVHPTQFPTDTNRFLISKFMANPNRQLIQVGAWLRDTYGIYQVSLPREDKTKLPPRIVCGKAALKGRQMDSYYVGADFFPRMGAAISTDSKYGIVPGSSSPFPIGESGSGGIICRDDGLPPLPMSRGENEANAFTTNKWIKHMYQTLQEAYDDVEILEWAADDTYDNLLACNVVFLKLVDASACNTVVECIVRNTPLVVNRHPALEELLGASYPGFYDTIADVPYIIANAGAIAKMAKYISSMNKTDLTLAAFVNGVSSIVASL